jgi:alpha-mannosidase
MEKAIINVTHSSHLDLFWIGNQNVCLEKGAKIINDSVAKALKNEKFFFVIDAVRFLEYYLYKYPANKDKIKQLFDRQQLEIGACYTDRLENHHDGESLVRNVVYGKKLLSQLLGIDTEIAVHPDLPGLAEQTPQIYKKSGVKFYTFARGFQFGARFNWKGLDGSTILAYNYPVHYAYYDLEKEVLPFVDEIRKSICSKELLISCSAGDLGDAGKFALKTGSRTELKEMLEEIGARHPEIEFRHSGLRAALDRMSLEGLDEKSGESPSRWGTYGSATNSKLFLLDKVACSELIEAEKYSTVCDLLELPSGKMDMENPLKNKGYAGGIRYEMDIAQKPVSLSEWINFAWRLMLVTHDHNYGGIEGALTDFDRTRFKEAALEIAGTIKRLSQKAICKRVDMSDNSVIVFNSLNWNRTSIVKFNNNKLDTLKNYIAVDSDNNRKPIVRTKDWYAFSAEVPSFGYNCYKIIESQESDKPAKRVLITDEAIVLRNKYYKIVIDKKLGRIDYIKDMELDRTVVDDPEFLQIDAYEDFSNDVHELEYHKKLIDSSKNHTREVFVEDDNDLFSKVIIITEICDSKVLVEVSLNNLKKEISIVPKIYWTGKSYVQLKLNLCFRNIEREIFYAVPYGIQKFGNYMDGAYPFNPTDEICNELFEEYREVQGWFALQSNDFGVSVSTNQSSFAFKKDKIEAVLIRNVPSCGDNDVQIPNYGELCWEFIITSFSGDWEENHSYKHGWERQYPLNAELSGTENAELPGTDDNDSLCRLPGKLSFFDIKGNGILTVFKKSETESGRFIARLLNSTASVLDMSIANNYNFSKMKECDLNENPTEGIPDRLDKFEIKTVSFITKRKISPASLKCNRGKKIFLHRDNMPEQIIS